MRPGKARRGQMRPGEAMRGQVRAGEARWSPSHFFFFYYYYYYESYYDHCYHESCSIHVSSIIDPFHSPK